MGWQDKMAQLGTVELQVAQVERAEGAAGQEQVHCSLVQQDSRPPEDRIQGNMGLLEFWVVGYLK